MITKKERVERMMERFPPTPPFRHVVLAAEVLDKLSKELLKRKLGYLDDSRWLYHLLVPDGKGRWLSLFCGGFDKRIDIAVLRKDGKVDKRVREVSFRTPIGVANYVKRRNR